MSVVLFDEYKKKTKKVNPLTGDRYFCMTCDSDNFKILASGDVHCSGCTSRISTLFAEVSK